MGVQSLGQQSKLVSGNAPAFDAIQKVCKQGWRQVTALDAWHD